jgi:hypothetical protein
MSDHATHEVLGIDPAIAFPAGARLTEPPTAFIYHMHATSITPLVYIYQPQNSTSKSQNRAARSKNFDRVHVCGTAAATPVPEQRPRACTEVVTHHDWRIRSRFQSRRKGSIESGMACVRDSTRDANNAKQTHQQCRQQLRLVESSAVLSTNCNSLTIRIQSFNRSCCCYV